MNNFLMEKSRRWKSKETKTLDYLGMQFDMNETGEVKITMKHHVNKVIEEFPDPL